MSYADLSFVRNVTNLGSSDISDSDISVLRDRAENKLIKDITIEREGEEMDPNLDGSGLNGSNNTFYTHSTPIADVTRDETVGSSDVTVYVWGNSTNESTRSEVTVSSVDPDTGRVTLGEAPSGGADEITISYSFYNNESVPDWNLVEMASAFMTGYLGVIKLRGAVPESYSVGDLQIDDDFPGESFLREYRSTINDIRDLTSKG